MNRLIETKNVFKHITREITAKCASKGHTITTECALRILKMTLRGGDYETCGDQLTYRQIQRLISACVARLTEAGASRTIEMQVYYSANYCTRDDIVALHHRVVLSRCVPLIAVLKQPTGNEDFKSLYRQLVEVITLLSGLGNPTAAPVLKEATAALHSVFPLSELSRFLALSDDDKMKQILELKQIVCGIRLFNRDSHKGGEGIDDMPSILQQAVTATKDLVMQSSREAADELSQLSDWLGRAFGAPVAATPARPPPPPLLPPEEVASVRRRMVHLTQFNLYLRVVMEDVKACERDIVVLCGLVTDRLLQLHDTVRYRTAIPTNQVYPQFMELSEAWSGLQDQMVVLSSLNQILYTLQKMSKVEEVSEETLNLLKELPMPPTPKKASVETKVQPSKVKCEVLELVNTENCDPKNIQYYAHCAFRFAQTGGGLFPSDLELGLLRHEGLLFAFSTAEAAHAFGSDPDRYYQEGLDLVVNKPELVVLFDMDEQIQNLKPIKTPGTVVVQKVDAEMQTELHPLPPQIHPGYGWNIWDYKRRAVHLADMCKMQTRSVQTDRCCKRLSIGVQANPSRAAGVQTSTDVATNPPALGSFIPGLRGGDWIENTKEASHQVSYVPRCTSSTPSEASFKIVKFWDSS